MATDAEITAQLNRLRSEIARANQMTSNGVISDNLRNSIQQMQQQAMALQSQQQAMRGQAASQISAQKTNDAQRKAEEAQQKILGTAQGGIDRLSNDPTDKLFRDYLQRQMGAQVLDPNGKPFQEGAPQYNAQGYEAQGTTAQGYNAQNASARGYDAQGVGGGQQGQAFTYNPERMDAQSVSFRDPFDQQTIGAMVNEQAAGAGAAESARNQLMRDAVLASGGNAFDPSLRAAQAESMSERNRAVANARNQINIVANRENAATQNAAAAQNANYGQQARQFNATAGNQAGQFNAANQQQASFNNAQLGQQAGMFNAGAMNQAGQFNAAAQNQVGMFNAGNQNQAAQFGAAAQNQAGMFNASAQNQAGQFNAGAQNQAGMFNVGNQMQAQNANFNAGQQARMYNQGVQSGAAGQLGQYNNQRQGMMYDAEGRLIDVVGRQVFRGPETQMNMPLPNFQQFSSGGGTSGVTYAPGYFNSAIPQTAARGTYANPSGTSAVWAGSGRTPQGSGTTTTNFQSGYTGTPFYQQASQYVNRTPAQSQLQQPQQNQQPSIWQGMNQQQQQVPGVKQPYASF